MGNVSKMTVQEAIRGAGGSYYQQMEVKIKSYPYSVLPQTNYNFHYLRPTRLAIESFDVIGI